LKGPHFEGPQCHQYRGESIREVDVITAFSQLAEEADRMEAETGQGSEAIIGTSMLDADIAKLLLWSESNICTDDGIVDLHPRKAGAFPRVLGRYVREQEQLSLEKAVHKMTGLAAKHMGFTDRGLIKEGSVADLVLFDPETVIDRATPEQPELLATGITSVWVGGELVYDNGNATESRTGRVIRRAPATP
jgi:N-acyl-D-amino-acid deacylase